MTTLRTVTTGGILFVLALAAILAAQIASGTSGGTASSSAIEDPTKVVASEETAKNATILNTTASPTDVLDPIGQQALTYTLESGMVESGVPEVVLSRPVMDEELNTLELGTWTFEQGCDIPMQVVIVRGDFNVASAMPASVVGGTRTKVAYVVYVYDARIRESITWFGDSTGALVKQALGDPTLPDSATGETLATYPMPIPCDPTSVEVPGASEEEVQNWDSTPPPTR